MPDHIRTRNEGEDDLDVHVVLATVREIASPEKGAHQAWDPP
jgi:hypothetical protein